LSSGRWIDYAGRLEKAGADALELNVFVIPVAMKMGHHFTGMANIFKALSDEGADWLVLFNRFYRPDVDIENFRVIPAKVFSVPQEITLPFQWIAILSPMLKCDLAATTGVHNSGGLIKQLLVEAKAVQVCSALYQNGIGHIRTLISCLQNWMERHNFNRIEDFRGMLSQENIENPEVFHRSQYIKALVGIA